MMPSILLLGRQPALGRAELESLYGADTLQPVGEHAMLCSLPAADIAFARLGGSVKLCRVVETIQDGDWQRVQTAVIAAGVRLEAELPPGKLQLGLSAYGLRVSVGQLTAAGLELKKALRGGGRTVRLVQNQTLALNSAQILHNHLTGERGVELVLVRDDRDDGSQRIIIARTIAEQDIEAYAARDQDRPKRDAFVGMLPPKLAQIIVNVAVAQTPPSPEFVVLDPFCGTGVILQEALLMGYSVYGTDLEQRMVDYSIANVNDWLLRAKHPDLRGQSIIAKGDATSHQWQESNYNKRKDNIRWEPARLDAIASEAYLGQPFSTTPSPEKLAKVRKTCNLIIEKFLKNVRPQLPSGARLCLAVPAWQLKPDHFAHLPLLDRLGELGYNRIDFRYARGPELLYYRPDQIVARELLVIIRK